MASTSPSQTKAATASQPVQEAKALQRSDTPSSGEATRFRVALAANCCLLLVGVCGGALLAWWALSFHRSNEQLWMVPVGLVLLGTPVFVWLSIFASGVCTCHELLWTAPAVPRTAPPPDLDPER
ncbi:hypothetical protein C4D60_Mb11t19170 [Musa balbisiana]|uniref:Uncharacterized protein n=1 Tax=Musa balbisiana TaxID=52838 RepID=A0A4S8J583_MUSBA|nr:hypothetical protein C4D60_Mb11t19170 [Musa balbisiana]